MNNLSVLFAVNELNLQLFKVVAARYKKMGLAITPVHGRIILFLSQSQSPVCQRDIEICTGCNKSTISSVLNTMEKNGFIERVGSENDLRKKNILLTDQARQIVSFLENDQQDIEETLCQNITEDEFLTFYQILEKMRKNIERISYGKII